MAVDPDGQIPGQLDVLLLVVAHGHHVDVVEQDVRRHQHRIGEKAGSHRLLALALGLELGHPEELAGVGAAVEDPAQLGVGRDRRLYEHDGLLGVDAHRHVKGGHVQDVLPQLLGVLGDGDGVLIDYAVQAFAVLFVLKLHELYESAEIIANVDVSCGLNAREDPLHR